MTDPIPDAVDDQAAGRGETVAVPGGLDGVAVGETAVGDVRGAEGFYHYREYSAVDLARTRSLEDVAHLLVHGRLPRGAERSELLDRIAAWRLLPPVTAELLPAIARAGLPTQTLRTAISLVGTELGWGPSRDLGDDALRDQALRLWALLPTAVAAAERSRRGLPLVEPRPGLTTASNFLWMLHGTEPDPVRTNALEQYLVIVADHGLNASTFAARVITSTGSDVASAICGALGALAGPLHGGAPSRVLDMLEEIGDPAAASAWVSEAVRRNMRIMGFGHRLYRTDDPRAVYMRDVALDIGGPLAELAVAVAAAATATLEALKPGRRVRTNVELYAAVVLAQCGIGRHLFTSTFALGRALGWSAHVVEQAATRHLVRPGTRYVGPPPPQPVPPAD